MTIEAQATPSQLKLFSRTLDQMARKVAQDEPTLGVEFPHVTAPDGSS